MSEQSDDLEKINVDDLPSEFALVDGDGNVVMSVIVGDGGYVNVDLKGVDVEAGGARVFEQGGPEQENGPTISDRHDVEIPEVDDNPSFLSVDGQIDTE